jgi:hypothetical protein
VYLVEHLVWVIDMLRYERCVNGIVPIFATRATTDSVSAATIEQCGRHCRAILVAESTPVIPKQTGEQLPGERQDEFTRPLDVERNKYTSFGFGNDSHSNARV